MPWRGWPARRLFLLVPSCSDDGRRPALDMVDRVSDSEKVRHVRNSVRDTWLPRGRPGATDSWPTSGVGQLSPDQVRISTTDDRQQFLRWSEAVALDEDGTIRIESHSMLHRRMFCGPRIVGFVKPDGYEHPLFDLPKFPHDRAPWTSAALEERAGTPNFREPAVAASRPSMGLRSQARRRVRCSCACAGRLGFLRS